MNKMTRILKKIINANSESENNAFHKANCFNLLTKFSELQSYL